jgi:uncharacterized Zn-finger protein
MSAFTYSEKIGCLLHRLDDHMVESHSYTRNQYQCEHCTKGFAWRPNLLRHKTDHGEFRRFPCENCDKVSIPKTLHTYAKNHFVDASSQLGRKSF